MFLVLCSTTVYLVTSTQAENRAGAVSVSPLIGGYIFDDDQSINSDPTYGVVLGYNISERLSIEGAFNYVDTDVRSATLSNEVKAYVYRLEGLYHFMADKDVLPYIAVGAGAITLDADGGDNDTDILANYGAGIKFFLTESLALRTGVRHVISFDDTNHNILYKVGLSYLIGAKPPRDSDGDGVPDDMDTCAGTAAGVKVDNLGCPMDSDGDGVPDDMDTCAGTAAGVKVDNLGCPMD
ncbi:MAG: outer membrane beta-barrel domain-containing protein, partial [Nitrospiraceae bacterium]